MIDTPGLARGRRRARSNQLERYMVDEALAALSGVDVLLLVVEAPHGPARERATPEVRIGPDGALELRVG